MDPSRAMNLRWVVTRIPGDCLKNAGLCMDGKPSIGRVRRHEYGFKPPEWHWSMYADAPGTIPRSFAFHGKVDTKEQAKAAVEEAYGHFVAAKPDARAYYQQDTRE